MSVAIGMMAVGTAYNMYSQYKAGKEAQASAERLAAQRELQANELLRRAEENALTLDKQGIFAISKARGQADVSDAFSSDLISMTSAHRRVAEVKASMLEEAEWEAYQIRIGADNTREQGEIAEQTGRTQAFSSLLSGAASISKYVDTTPKYKVQTITTQEQLPVDF